MPSKSFSHQDSAVEVQRWVPSTCGICSIGCGVDVAVADGRIVGVRGTAGHPVNDGRLGPKGLNQYLRQPPSKPRDASVDSRRHPAGSSAPHGTRRCNSSSSGSTKRRREGPDGVGIYNSGQLLLEEYYTLGKIARAGLGIADHRREHAAVHRHDRLVADGIVRRRRAARRVRGLRACRVHRARSATTPPNRAPCCGCGFSRRSRPASPEDHRHRSAPHADRRQRAPICTCSSKPGTNVALLNGTLPPADRERHHRSRLHRQPHGQVRPVPRHRRPLHAGARRGDLRRSRGAAAHGRRVDRAVEDDRDDLPAGRVSEQSGHRRRVHRQQHAPVDGQGRPARAVRRCSSPASRAR